MLFHHGTKQRCQRQLQLQRHQSLIRSISTTSFSSSSVSWLSSSSSLSLSIDSINSISISISSSSNRRSFSSWKITNDDDDVFRKNSVLPPIDVVTKKNYSKSAYASTTTSTAAATMNNSNNNKKGDEEETKALASLSSSWDVLGLQSLVPEWKKMFNKDTVYMDISAGLTVGCVAIPLSLAIALASGVPAEVGLVTAVVSGVAGGLLGGTTLAVTGPAAAISLLVIGAVEQHGLEALPVITLGCGMLQVVSGMSKLGVVAKLCPVSVIAGFTTGVGTLILTNQLPKALGMTAPSGLNPLELLVFIGDHAAQHINPSAAALAIGTSAAMFALPKLHPKMPSALVAVGGATVATHALGLDVSLIGTIPSGLDAFQFGIPTVPPVEAFPSLAASTFLIYAMTSVESLLSCASLEKMKKTTYKHCPDQELIGQGVANLGSAMFMGMPVTSVIARSALNARMNAQTRLPALIQSGFVFTSVVFMSSTIAMIPMPALSGVLITTGMSMLTPTEFKHCYAVQKSDTIPFLATIGGMISLGLAEGIGIGCTTALGMNLYQTYAQTATKEFIMKAFQLVQLPPPSLSSSKTTSAKEDIDDATVATQVWQARCGEQFPMVTTVDTARGVHTMVESSSSSSSNSNERTFKDDDIMNEVTTMMDPTKNTVWQLSGPINFLSMFEIDSMIKRIEEQKNRQSSTAGSASAITTNAIVLDMQNVTIVEFTGVEELVNRLFEISEDIDAESGEMTSIPIQMVNINNPDIERALDQCDPSKKITRISYNQ